MWKTGCEAGACVEVADIGSDVLIRDSKDPTGQVLRFTREEWENFTDAVKEGKFD